MSQVAPEHLRKVSRGQDVNCRFILSNVLIRGLGSNAWFVGPDRLRAGTALSDSSSTKSLTMKSLFENLSKVKLGPVGNKALFPLLMWAPSGEAIDNYGQVFRTSYYSTSRPAIYRVLPICLLC
jgi:hypothetical protein